LKFPSLLTFFVILLFNLFVFLLDLAAIT